MGCHHGHRPCPALPYCDDLSSQSGHRQDDCNFRLFAMSGNTNSIFQGFVIWMSGENDTYRILWLVSGAILCVTGLIYRSHRMGGHGTNFVTRVTYSSQSNSKLHSQEDNHTPTTIIPPSLSHHPPPPHPQSNFLVLYIYMIYIYMWWIVKITEYSMWNLPVSIFNLRLANLSRESPSQLWSWAPWISYTPLLMNIDATPMFS